MRMRSCERSEAAGEAGESLRSTTKMRSRVSGGGAECAAGAIRGCGVACKCDGASGEAGAAGAASRPLDVSLDPSFAGQQPGGYESRPYEMIRPPPA